MRSTFDLNGSRSWTYVRQARVRKGPGERPAAGVALDQLRKSVVGNL